MTLIVSDINLDKPILWNFGKIDIKFKKPTDPSNLNPSFKHVQKPKMEVTFAPEKTNTNYIPSFIFCILISCASLYYSKHLQDIKVNFQNFPNKNNKAAYFFALCFLGIILFFGYFFIQFWVNLTIKEITLFLCVLCIVGAIFGYNTLKYVKIDV